MNLFNSKEEYLETIITLKQEYQKLYSNYYKLKSKIYEWRHNLSDACWNDLCSIIEENDDQNTSNKGIS